MFDRVTFVIGEAFVALRRNLAMSIAGITTGAVALFLLGLLSFTILVANDYAKSVPNMFDMRVFLNDGTSKDEVKKTVQAIRGIAGVAQVTWIPRDNAWLKMQREEPELTRGLENPLPEQVRVIVSDLARAETIATSIQELPTVAPEDGVHYLRKEQQIANAFLQALRLLGPEVAGLLIFATGVLIYNTIRLTVLARRLEIRIMQLVGAPQSMVRVPFLIEGTVQGLVAGIFSGLLLLASLRVLQGQLRTDTIGLAAFPIRQAMALMSLTGGGYGLLCSLFAVRVPLQYR
jgi:cell division transport system permease protein